LSIFIGTESFSDAKWSFDNAITELGLANLTDSFSDVKLSFDNESITELGLANLTESFSDVKLSFDNEPITELGMANLTDIKLFFDKTKESVLWGYVVGL
jgi:hypothetical protein